MVILLLTGVMACDLFALPIVRLDEIVSLSFLWLAMLGSVIGMHRNKHLRGYLQAFALRRICVFPSDDI